MKTRYMSSHFTKKERRAIELIKEILKDGYSCGALHIVLYDGNIEDMHIKWCLDNSIAELEGKEREMYQECAELLLEFKERRRTKIICTAFNDKVGK